MLSVADPDLEPSWGGGSGGEGGFLPLTLPPFLPSAILSFFFFFTQNKGVGGGGTDPRVPTFDPLLHILRTPYTWGNECWKFESCFTFMDFSARSKEHTFWKLARLSQPKENQFSLLLPPLRTPEECYLIDSYFGSRHWRWYWIYPQAPNCKQLLDEVFVISRII